MHINTHGCANRPTQIYKETSCSPRPAAATVIKKGANWISVGELQGFVDEEDLDACYRK